MVCKGLRAFAESLVTQDGDTPDLVLRKVLNLALTTGALLVCLVSLLRSHANGRSFQFAMSMAGVLYKGGHLLALLTTKSFGDKYQVIELSFTSVLIAWWDVVCMIEGRRGWGYFVLIIDALLLGKAPLSHRRGMLLGMAAWLVFTAAELQFRFGLLDLPGTLDYQDRAPQCAEPPCADKDALDVHVLPALVIIFLDYLATSHFADSMQQEQQRLGAAADAAERIAKFLVAYDLKSAGEYLKERASVLPEDFTASFGALLGNLESYRPYLPQELFHCPAGGGGGGSGGRPYLMGPAPSDPTIRAGIVVTSLRNCAELWTRNGQKMSAVFDTYSAQVRAVLEASGGREVSACGDCFMLSFEGPLPAVRFGISLQIAVADERQWPRGLLRAGAVDDGFAPVTVRLGVDFGQVTCEPNTLTRRVEYYGPTVTRAIRAGQIGVPGTATVTESVVSALWDEDSLSVHGQLEIIPHQAADGGLPEVWAVVPHHLHTQISFVKRKCGMGSVSTKSPTSMGSKSPTPSRGSSGGVVVPHRQSGNSSFTMSISSDELTADPGLALRESTMRLDATVGVVKYASWQEGLEDESWESIEATLTARLAALHAHLEATRGHMSIVVNDLVVTTWGMYGTCGQHVNESARFIMLLSNPPPAGGPLFHAGLATGPLACGVIAASFSQRHVTPMGPCVDAALMLCATAAEMRATVLLVTMQPPEQPMFVRFEGSDVLRDHMWPVDTWLLPIDNQRRALVVYRLDVQGAAAAAADSDVSIDDEAKALQLKHYCSAFAAGDADMVAGFAGTFPAAAAVAGRLKDKAHLPHGLASCAPSDGVDDLDEPDQLCHIAPHSIFW